MSKLYIDFSETHCLKLNTGIQRVVKNIITRKKNFQQYDFKEVTSVIQIGSGFYSCDLGETLQLQIKHSLFSLALKLRHGVDFLFETVGQKNNIKNDTLHNDSLKKNSSRHGAITTHMNVVLFFRYILKYLFMMAGYIDELFLKKRKISFSEKDILFLPDAFWSVSFSMKAVSKAKKKGARIIVLFHDIIPITHSQLAEEKHQENFKKAFPNILNLADGFICNSAFTLSEVTFHLNKHFTNLNHLPADFFLLGCDFEAKTRTFDFPFNHKNMYLMVSTIEPRKNHDFVLNAFHSYWNQGGKERLVIVGKIGWNCEQTMNRIFESPYYNKTLFCFNHVSDDELAKFYSSCKALIFASIIEGFGLPLVEAMNYNKTIFASDIPVFKEIAKEYPFYFDLNNTDSLIELLKKYETGQLKLKSSKPSLISWNDSINQLALKISKMAVKPC